MANEIETPAPENAQDQAPEIDYKAEHQKLQEQLKQYDGVDLERWNKAKEFDFDRAEKAIEFQEQKEREAREAEEAKDREESERDPVTGLKKEISTIKQTLAEREAKEKEKAQADWMQKFDQSLERSIEKALKSDDFKGLEELTAQEKKYVITMVNQEYERDAAQKTPKLNLESVGKVVSSVIKEVQDNRAILSSKRIRSQNHPITPSAAGDGALPPKPRTDGERLEAMVNFYKGGREGQV